MPIKTNPAPGNTTTAGTRPAAVSKPTVTRGRSASTAGNGQPSYEQIAACAYSIWQSKGCPQGQDEANWSEAETQLRRGAASAS